MGETGTAQSQGHIEASNCLYSTGQSPASNLTFFISSYAKHFATNANCKERAA